MDTQTIEPDTGIKKDTGGSKNDVIMTKKHCRCIYALILVDLLFLRGTLIKLSAAVLISCFTLWVSLFPVFFIFGYRKSIFEYLPHYVSFDGIKRVLFALYDDFQYLYHATDDALKRERDFSQLNRWELCLEKQNHHVMITYKISDTAVTTQFILDDEIDIYDVKCGYYKFLSTWRSHIRELCRRNKLTIANVSTRITKEEIYEFYGTVLSNLSSHPNLHHIDECRNSILDQVIEQKYRMFVKKFEDTKYIPVDDIIEYFELKKVGGGVRRAENRGDVDVCA